MKQELLEKFFEHPLLGVVIEEALQAVESDDDTIPDDAPPANGGPEPKTRPKAAGKEVNDKIMQLSEEFKSGSLDQNDLINMFKSGRLTKEEIQQIVELASDEQGGAEGGEAPVGAPAGGEEAPSPEELMAQQIEQTNDMFVKFAIYDKVADLTGKLTFFENNFNDIKGDFYDQVIQLKEFLNILSSLIFNIETNVAYQMYGSLLLQLTELFNEYNVQQNDSTGKEEFSDANSSN